MTESIKKIAGAGASSGSPAWSLPGRVTASDNSRTFCNVTAQSISGELHVYNFSVNVPIGATIVGIVVELEHRASATPVLDYSLYLRGTAGTAIGSNKASITTWSTATDGEEVSYGGATDLWGATLTWDVVNHANFGIILVAENTHATNQRTASVDVVWVTVYYDFAAAKCDLVWMVPGSLDGLQVDTPVGSYNTLVAEIASNLTNNSYIDDVFLSAWWKNIEPSESSFSWTRLDGVIDAIIAAGKTFKFGIMPGIRCPDWIFNHEDIDLLQTVASDPNKPNYGETLYIPIPWNSTYQTKFFAAISAVAAHFDAKGYTAHCTTVKVTPWAFQSLELHLPRQPDDLIAWAALDAVTHLPTVMTATLAHYATEFPTQRLCLSTLWWILKNHTLTQALAAIALEGYSSVLDLQYNFMDGHTDVTNQARWVALRNWKNAYPDINLGCQSLRSLILPVDAVSPLQGTMRQTCANVRSCQADTYFEIWYGDGKNLDKSEAVATLLAGEEYVGGDEGGDDDGGDDGGADFMEEWRHPYGPVLTGLRVGRALHAVRRYKSVRGSE